MTEELVIREIRVDDAAGQGNSDSWMTSLEVIMPLLTPINYESLWDEMRCIVSDGNSWKWMRLDGKMMGWS